MFNESQSKILSILLLIYFSTITLALIYPEAKFGFLGHSFLTMAVSFLLAFHMSMITISIYLHRSETHRAVKYSKTLRHFFRLWLWLFTGLDRKEWVSVHRYHHKGPDTAKDPHSPSNLGMKAMLWHSCELYVRAYQNPEVSKLTFITDYDWLEKHIYSSKFGVVAGTCLCSILFGLWGLPFYILLLTATIVIQFYGINGFGHHAGKRNYDTSDNSHNITRFGILIAGEELHNNHHQTPDSARFSHLKNEYDIGWLYILILSKMRLAQIKRI